MSAKKHIFTPIERTVFKDLLKKYAAIIENKCTDGASLQKKKEAWAKLQSEYNASSHVTAQVTSQQLKRLWMNMKQRQREAMTKERQHRFATGGGPSTSDAVIDADIAQIAPALIVGIDGAIDSDTTAEFAVVADEMETSPLPSTSSSVFVFPELTQTSTSISPTPIVHTPRPPTPLPIVPNLLPSNPCLSTPCLRPATPRPSIPRPPSPTSTRSFQRQKNNILQREYEDRKRRTDEIHELEMKLLKEKIRETKAKADLAILLLELQRHATDNNPDVENA